MPLANGRRIGDGKMLFIAIVIVYGICFPIWNIYEYAKEAHISGFNTINIIKYIGTIYMIFTGLTFIRPNKFAIVNGRIFCSIQVFFGLAMLAISIFAKPSPGGVIESAVVCLVFIGMLLFMFRSKMSIKYYNNNEEKQVSPNLTES